MLIDWNRIQSFADEDDPDDKEWLMGMIDTLISNTEERLSELDSLMISKEQDSLRSLLHQLKGVAANFGLNLMQETCIEAETRVRALDIEGAIADSKKLREIWNQTKAEILNKYPR